MTDFLDEKRKEITDRLKELKPLVDEYQRLEAAASALAGVGGSTSSSSSGWSAKITSRKVLSPPGSKVQGTMVI